MRPASGPACGRQSVNEADGGASVWLRTDASSATWPVTTSHSAPAVRYVRHVAARFRCTSAQATDARRPAQPQNGDHDTTLCVPPNQFRRDAGARRSLQS